MTTKERIMKAPLLLSLTAAVCLLGAPAFADSVDEYYKIDERLEKMKTDLKLTDEQAKEIKPVMENYKDKLHEARKEKEEKLEKILSAEQNDQMKQYKEDMNKSEKGWWQF
jgi:Spy/CpxP family protein refolding chaperone